MNVGPACPTAAPTQPQRPPEHTPGSPDQSPAPTDAHPATFSLSRHCYELAQQAAALTNDQKSLNRFRQLAGIALNAGHRQLWDAAFAATRARLTKAREPLAAPGAYFCATLARLLHGEGVPVPVGTPKERAQVKALIAQSFQSARRKPG